MAEPQAISLADFDADDTFRLDPAVRERNLTSLRTHQPQLADRLAASALPPAWRAVRAFDGFVTHRLEPTGQPPQWLGDTAIPLTRARAVVDAYRIGQLNATLPALDAGAELLLLLERLPQHVAVFVFENELAVIDAVLRAHDVSAALTAGRCWFIPPEDETTALLGLLQRHPGLNAPGNIVRLPAVQPGRLEAVRHACEAVIAQIGPQRDTRAHELLTAFPWTDATPPRVGIVALSPDATSQHAADLLATGVAARGGATLVTGVRSPSDGHLLGHLERLAEFKPTRIVCINHRATALPETLRSRTDEWWLDAAAVPSSLSAIDGHRAAASPVVRDMLVAAGATADQVWPWWWAAPPTNGPIPANFDGPPLLIGDLPDDRAAACGIEQPTHRRVWEALCQLAGRAWQTRDLRRPTTLVARAQRERQLDLDRTTRDRLTLLAERVALPAAELTDVARWLVAECGEVVVVGRGWDRLGLPLLRVVGPGLPAFERPPCAVVRAGAPDPLCAPLLDAGARGWPLVLHVPLPVRLGDVLQPDVHFAPFDDLKTLAASINLSRTQPDAVSQRIRRTAAHLRQNHTIDRRLDAWFP